MERFVCVPFCRTVFVAEKKVRLRDSFLPLVRRSDYGQLDRGGREEGRRQAKGVKKACGRLKSDFETEVQTPRPIHVLKVELNTSSKH